MVTEDSIVVVAEDQIFSDLAGEVVILDVKQGLYYGLNDVGARAWNLIQQPRKVSEVCAIIMEEYDVTPDQCTCDILALFSDLEAKGMVKIEDAKGA